MDQALIIVIGIGTGIAALGLLVQLGLWLAIYGVGGRMQKAVAGVTPKVRSLTSVAREVGNELKGEALLLRNSMRDAITITKRDVATVKSLRSRATGIVQHEREKVDDVFEDAVTRARQTSRFVGRQIATPIRGIARAIRRLRRAA